MLPVARVTKEDRAEMVRMVRETLGPEKAAAWWTTPNPMLGNVWPCWFSFTDRESKLRDFIRDAYEANQFTAPADQPVDRASEVQP